MGEATALFAQDSVIGILTGKLWVADGKGLALLHALEDEIDARLAEAASGSAAGGERILFTNAFLGPFDGDLAVGGVAVDPAVVVVGALSKEVFGDHRMTAHDTEEIHDVVFAGEEGDVAVDNDSIKAVIKPLKKRPEEFRKKLHRRCPFARAVQRYCFLNIYSRRCACSTSR